MKEVRQILTFEGTTEDIADLIRRCMNNIENTISDHYPDSDFVSLVCDQQRQRALEELPNINFHHSRENLRAAEANAEITRLKEQVQGQAKTIAKMRDEYWTLSRRLKFFACDFCMDESLAGAIRFLVSESNSNWILPRRSITEEPADSEIPF